jgi:tRNA A37 threonylcarbamoyladenosine biosynthesis protein TsaE
MDPYRLGTKTDKMAGLIDWETAFSRDICLIEWPDRMPAAVMELPHRGLAVTVR